MRRLTNLGVIDEIATCISFLQLNQLDISISLQLMQKILFRINMMLRTTAVLLKLCLTNYDDPH